LLALRSAQGRRPSSDWGDDEYKTDSRSWQREPTVVRERAAQAKGCASARHPRTTGFRSCRGCAGSPCVVAVRRICWSRCFLCDFRIPDHWITAARVRTNRFHFFHRVLQATSEAHSASLDARSGDDVGTLVFRIRCSPIHRYSLGRRVGSPFRW
jgi:hypothetical protein